MNLAIAHTEQLGSSDTWLATNVTAWCNRMGASLSAAACEQNRNVPLNGRCFGCGGLYHQTSPPKQELPALDITTSDDCVDGLEDLDEIIDGLYENPAPGDDFEDVELELNEEDLIKLFPELICGEEITATEEKCFKEYQTEAPRRAVFMGRCRTCGGYIDNVREWHDDNVFRCLSCGWRTSPEYEQNRALQSAGGTP